MADRGKGRNPSHLVPPGQTLVLAVDVGSSTIKAVLFDAQGRDLAVSRRQVAARNAPGGVSERDPSEILGAAGSAIQEIVSAVPNPGDIACVGLTGAGDGLLLLDGSGSPARPIITSLDTRAASIIERWKAAGITRQGMALIGEVPFGGTPAALLRWIKENEPDVYRRAASILHMKDWVKLWLTGALCTDRTDASATLTDSDGVYDRRVFDLFGIEEAFAKTVRVTPSHEVIGGVTPEAAARTGLVAGTPVVSGLHDCSASALGAGCLRQGETSVIVGTWSGNQVVATSPVIDDIPSPHWILRCYVEPRSWLLISASPASSVNVDWFLDGFLPAPAAGDASAAHTRCDNLVARAAPDAELVYLPFLHGSQQDPRASAGFIGVRPWQGPPDFLRAVYEGIAINHALHLRELARGTPIESVTACGGGTRSAVLMQLLADALAREVGVSATAENSALGAAMTAAVGIGLYHSYAEAVRGMGSERHCFAPTNAAYMEKKREIFEKCYAGLSRLWAPEKLPS